MGFTQWRQRRSMRDPVRGEFRPTGSYSPHPNGSNAFHEMMTGVVLAPGVSPTAGEAMQDTGGKWVGHDSLPALVDRADPTNFQIVWDEVEKLDERANARAAAEQAARTMQVGPVRDATPSPPAPFEAPGAGVSTEWARGLVADLAKRGMIPGLDADSFDAVTVDVPEVTIQVDGAPGTGVPGTAVLRDVADIVTAPGSLPFADGSLCTLTLEVKGTTGPYTVQSRLGFRSPRTRAAIAVPGRVLPVRIDPTDPQRVTVDVAEFYRQNPGLAP